MTAIAILLMVLGATGAASGRIGATRPSRPATPHTVVAPAGYRAAHPLPDTVLARLDGRVDITASRFVRATGRLSARPDSLTPKERQRFLDLLIDQQVLADRVAQERWNWTAQESSSAVYLADHLVLQVALDSALSEAAAAREARGEPALDQQALGILVRDSTVDAMKPRWDDARLARVAEAFVALPRPSGGMSVLEQMRIAGAMPHVAPQDSLGVLAETAGASGETGSPYSTADLLADWKRLNPIYRPRISTADQVRDLVRNGLYERELRRAAAAQGLQRRPAVAAAIAERAEYTNMQHFVGREVYAGLKDDSLTLRRHYREHLADWDLPARATVIRLTLGERAAADEMMRNFTVPGAAESLAVRAGRQGLSYGALVTAETDSALLERVQRAGVGAVLGPDSLADGWRVVKVLSVEPARHRTYDEARVYVQKDWYDREGERRMRALLDDLRRRRRIVVNERWLRTGLRAAVAHP